MSITTHAAWSTLLPFIVIEQYGRDTGPRGARVRIEVERPKDGRLLRWMLAVTMPCVACGRTIHPIRVRQGTRARLYYAATCPLDETFACARGPAARDEYLQVRAAVRRERGPHAEPRQVELPLDLTPWLSGRERPR